MIFDNANRNAYFGFFSLLFLFSETCGFGIDYFDGSSLRTENNLGCNDKSNYDCEVQCGNTPAMCHQGKCYCLYNMINVPTHAKKQPETISEHLEEISRPIFRHHIAHFCPNLDEARNCIRKCMKIGKPAFCGKDHVCYCGHKYSNHDNDEEIDPAEVYSHFQDLYGKYFGVNNEIKKTYHKDRIIERDSRG